VNVSAVWLDLRRKAQVCEKREREWDKVFYVWVL